MRFDARRTDGAALDGPLTDGATFRLARLVCAADGHSAFIDEQVPFDAQLLSPPAAPLELALLGSALSVSVMRDRAFDLVASRVDMWLQSCTTDP